jgi:hypothetical protein
VPTIISQLVNLVYNMVDTIYIGMTGDAYKTAAVTLAFTIFMMTVSFANLFGIGGGSLIARLIGTGRSGDAKKVCAFSFYSLHRHRPGIFSAHLGFSRPHSGSCWARPTPQWALPGNTCGWSSFWATSRSSSP